MAKCRAFVLVSSVALTSLVLSIPAHAATTRPTPTGSATTTPEVRTPNQIVGLIILTAFAAGGYFVAKWIRRDRHPRPSAP